MESKAASRSYQPRQIPPIGRHILVEDEKADIYFCLKSVTLVHEITVVQNSILYRCLNFSDFVDFEKTGPEGKHHVGVVGLHVSLPADFGN